LFYVTHNVIAGIEASEIDQVQQIVGSLRIEDE